MFATVRGAIFQGTRRTSGLAGRSRSTRPRQRKQVHLYVRLLREQGVPALVIGYVTEENFAGVRDFLWGVSLMLGAPAVRGGTITWRPSGTAAR